MIPTDPAIEAGKLATPFERVKVSCPGCGWTGRRAQREAHEWRGRWVPTCSKCGFHPVKYGNYILDSRTRLG